MSSKRNMNSVEAPKQITMDNPLYASIDSNEGSIEETETNKETDNCVCSMYCCWCVSGIIGTCFTI